MRTTIFLLFLWFNFATCYAQTEALAVYQNNKVGYVNPDGSLLIKPQYKEGADFSEGFAKVRVGGLFGFIDTKNTLVIKPVYDFADNFDNGFAKVYRNGISLFLDKNGKEVFVAFEYEKATRISDTKVVLQKKEGECGLYDLKNSKWILPCKYGLIEDLGENLFLAHTSKNKHESDKIVADASGEKILSISKGEEVDYTEDGLIRVISHGKKKSTVSYYKPSGKLAFSIKTGPDLSFGSLSENRLSCSWYDNESKYHTLYKNGKGKTIISQRQYTGGMDFIKNRAFVELDNEEWKIIDTNGIFISEQSFDDVISNFFILEGANKIACIVRDENYRYGLIDANATYIIPATYSNLQLLDAKAGLFIAQQKDEALEDRIGDMEDTLESQLIKGLDTSIASTKINDSLQQILDDLDFMEIKDLYGVIDYKGATVIPMNYQLLYPVSNELFYFEKGKESGFLNLQNKVLWKNDTASNPPFDTLDISFMLRGYFYASSESEFIPNMLGGWGHSDNKPKEISKTAAEKGVVLEVDTHSRDTFYTSYAAYKVYLYNTSKSDTAVFDAQDSRLYINMQAQDSAGNWKDIEYLPSSWCGNSYHQVGLLPLQKWEFSCPVYKGIFKTQFRLKCMRSRKWNSEQAKYEQEDIIYSNTFSGSINPAQFWRKREYTPKGIMDPYND